MSGDAPFGPAVAGLVLAAAVHAGDAMPPRALVDHPLPGRKRNDAFVCRGDGKPVQKNQRR